MDKDKLQSIEAGMSEYFRMHDYRAMYDYFNKIILPELQNQVKNNVVSGDVSGCFSLARYIAENFKYHDNTDIGDVYESNNGRGLFSEEDIIKEWKSDED